MKKIFFIFLSLILMGKLFAQENIILNYEGSFLPFNGESVTRLCVPKSERVSNSCGGTIIVNYSDDMTEEMQYCLNMAIGLWEQKLFIPQDVKLECKTERFGKNAPDYKVEVTYCLPQTPDDIIYPQSYAVNIGVADRESCLLPDAKMIINTDSNWDFSFNEKEIFNYKSFPTAILQCIGFSLGFGSSLRKDREKGILLGIQGRLSPFDKLIVNSNNIYLGEKWNPEHTSTELTSYVTGDNVYFQYKDNVDFKLYAPDQYKDYCTLNYFDSRVDLMSYNIREGDRRLQIDEHTLKVMNAIGWRQQTKELEIIGENINSTGLTSAYTSHSFLAESTNGTILNHSWRLELADKNGDYTICKTSQTSNFTIDPIQDESLYMKNMDGDLKGRIILEATLNGVPVKKYCYVYLEIKPFFTSVKVDSIVMHTNNWYYDAYLTLMYCGTNKIYGEIEEENSVTVRTFDADEPYIAHLHLPNILADGKAWINLELINNQGSTKQIVEIPDQSSTHIRDVLKDEMEIEEIEVVNIQGQTILHTKNCLDMNALSKGIYILRIKRLNNPEIETIKWMIGY